MRVLAKLMGILVGLAGAYLAIISMAALYEEVSIGDASLLTFLVRGLPVVIGIGLLVVAQWIGNYFDDKR